MGAEFVIHIPEEYDYRYSSFDKREIILEIILKAFSMVAKGQLLPFFYIV